MPPVKDDAKAGCHDGMRARGGRVCGRNDGNGSRRVEADVRLEHQSGALVDSKRTERAVLEKGKLNLQGVEAHEWRVGRWHSWGGQLEWVIAAAAKDADAHFASEHHLQAAGAGCNPGLPRDESAVDCSHCHF